MPRKKKTETVAAEAAVKEVKETAAAPTVEEAPAKKTPAKRAAATKTAAPKAEVKAEAAAPAVEEVKAEAEAVAAPKAEVFIEFGGAQVPVNEIIKNAQNVVGADKDIKVYVQPENSKAYIAFDDQSVEMDVFFVQ